MRTTRVECGGYLSGRVGSRDPVVVWGAWCPRCCGWWPDNADGTRADKNRPAQWRLIDDPLTITPV